MAPPKKWEPVEKICEGCSTKFIATTGYAITMQRFCSRGCSLPTVHAAKRVPRIKRKCEQCSKVMRRVPSHFANREHVFCSNNCRGEWRAASGEFSGENSPTWQGGSSVWWKQKARERDDFTCQIDGCDIRDESRGTHAHHKLPKEAGGEDSLDNLVTLCDHHHQVMERKFIMMLIERAPKIAAQVIVELYS